MINWKLFHTYWESVRRIDRLKNSYGNFFIQSQSRNDFLTRGKSISSNQKSADKMNHSVHKAFTFLLAPLQSSFSGVCRIFTSLLQFSRKLAINHRPWWKVRTGFIALDKPIKKDIQEQQNKKIGAKTWREVPRTEGRGKESFKEGKYVMSIIDDKEFYLARKCLEARRKRL